MTAKWVNGRLDLGRLGALYVHDDGDGMWSWGMSDSGTGFVSEDRYATETAAQRAAVRWLRAALKQASKRVGD